MSLEITYTRLNFLLPQRLLKLGQLFRRVSDNSELHTKNKELKIWSGKVPNRGLKYNE